MNNLYCSLSTQQFPLISKLILSLALESLICAEPIMNCLECARVDSVVLLDILDPLVPRIVQIDADNFPVELALVKQAQRAEDLDSPGLTHPHNLVHAHLDNIEGIVVAKCARLAVLVSVVFPGLREHAIVEDGVEHVVSQVQLTRLFVFLHILLHWVVYLIKCHFHLGCGVPILI